MSELSEIFLKPPLECSPADDEKIIAYFKDFRINRKAFKKTGERKKTRTKKVKIDPAQIDLLIEEMSS
jgi:hypothetical protein